jgi:uncharacterized protein (DUF2249 family)
MNTSSQSIDLTYFDVREIPCRVKHTQIFQRWAALPIGHHFILVNDHDPVPLYYQLMAQFPGAFSWEYLVSGPDEFQVKITRLHASPTNGAAGPRGASSEEKARAPAAVSQPEHSVLRLDARGLEPPEPLIRILNTLETLAVGTTLLAITDREPCHLFGEASQRGFSHKCLPQSDGSWATVLARA